MNKLLLEDARDTVKHNNTDFTKFDNKTILITGATGLIGQNLVCTLYEAQKQLGLNVKLVLQVRNQKKTEQLFPEYSELEYIVGDIANQIIYNGEINYIIHAASQTSSKAFVTDPVGVAMTAIDGTRNLLEFARRTNAEGFIYLSTMEVYGAPSTDEKITETHNTDLDTMSVRSCYPESKRMCEMLCTSYHAQYDVPAKVLRLIQTFGPGVQYNDGRVFAEFARCAIEGKDIVLHTKGETKRSYLYTADAVTAILTVLLNGKAGNAYNAANEDTYCSIYEMAELVAAEFSAGKTRVKIEETDSNRFGYAPVLHMNLDTRKLQSLGWSPSFNMRTMFERLIRSMEEDS